MIICGECGRRSPRGTEFCPACGTFLEWEAPEDAVTVPATRPEPATESDSAGTEPARTESPRTESPRTESPRTESPRTESPRTDPVRTEISVDPSRPGEAQPITPEARKPGATRVILVPARDEPDQRDLGGLVCAACGAGNDPKRRFCRACGRPLAQRAAEPERRLSWWRRFIAWLFRRRAYEAGTRRRVAGPRNWVRPLVVVLTLVGVAVVLAVPARGLASRAITAVRDRTADHVPVAAAAVRASSSAPGTEPGLLSDGASNRFWAPTGPPVGAWVEADFSEPIRLLDVIVTTGVAGDKKQFVTEGRPSQLDAVITSEGGKEVKATLKLQDRPGQQRFTVKASDARRIRFTIASTFGMPPGRICAIAELEFFTRG